VECGRGFPGWRIFASCAVASPSATPVKFALKAAACRGIGELIGKQLHRNATIQLVVERLVYDAHTTFTKLTLNSVRTTD
jgi:hypothetical protein